MTVDAVRFAAQRVKMDVARQEEAYNRLARVPRAFLMRVLRECIKAAQDGGVTEIIPGFLDRIPDIRSKDRGR